MNVCRDIEFTVGTEKNLNTFIGHFKDISPKKKPENKLQID